MNERASTFPGAAKIQAELRRRAGDFQNGFPAMEWKVSCGEELRSCLLKNTGQFENLPLLRSGELVFETELQFPLKNGEAILDGGSLELTINSLYPMRLECNGKVVFEDLSPVPVAAGPALVNLSSAIGDDGVVRLRQTVFLPDNQLMPWWHQLRFTTGALRRGFEAFDIFAAQLELAIFVATDAMEIAACEKAAAVAAKWMETEDWQEHARAREGFEDALEPFRQKIGGLSVHLIGHSHIDLNWLWTWQDTVGVVRRDIRSVLGLMEEFPELTFSHSQPATYEIIEREEPACFQRILEHVKAGRWEPISMTWVEQDSNMTGAEAHARQLLHGVRYTESKLGVSPQVYHAPDTFGHPGNLPQLAISAGAKYYYHHRCNPGGSWPAYWWEGNDGSRILALTTPGYNGEITAGEIARAAMRASKAGLAEGLHFHGIGDHGGGPSRHNLQTLRRLKKLRIFPQTRCSTLAGYGEEVLASGVELPMYCGESRTIFEGCYTTHGDTKSFNRRGESLLLTAETLSALAGQDARESLTDAWRTVLFNQFHDIVAGSAIHEVYDEQALGFQKVAEIAERVSSEALGLLGQDVARDVLAVFNPLGEAGSDWIFVPGEPPMAEALSDGTHISRVQRVEGGWGFVAEAEGYGRADYSPASLPPEMPEVRIEGAYAPFDNREDNVLGSATCEAPYYRIETDHFVIYQRRDCGVMVGFFDKKVNRELVSFGMRRQSDYLDTARPDLAMAVLQIVRERPHRMSSWQIHEVYSEESLISGGESEIIESGPARCVVETTHVFGQSRIRQRTIFYAELPWVDFETTVDWNEPGNDTVGIPNLKIAFNARLPECEAWCEMPFGAERRPADGQEMPMQRWAAVGGESYSMALLNEGKYGCDILGTRLRLSLVRSAYDPDLVADLGSHLIKYRLVPHAGCWREAGIVGLASGFNQPLMPLRAGLGGGGRIAEMPRPMVRGEGVRLTCLKKAEEGDGYVFRLHECWGRPGEIEVDGIPPGWQVFETDVTERSRLSREARGLQIAFGAWQVRTFLVERL
ncbi:alpha-mannosidase [soil metagenome]